MSVMFDHVGKGESPYRECLQMLLHCQNLWQHYSCKNRTGERFHFHILSWRRMRIMHVGPYHTRPASTNTQLSSAASWLLNDCWFLLKINASVLATVGELGDLYLYGFTKSCLMFSWSFENLTNNFLALRNARSNKLVQRIGRNVTAEYCTSLSSFCCSGKE